MGALQRVAVDGVSCLYSFGGEGCGKYFFEGGNSNKDIKYYVKQGSFNSFRMATGPAAGTDHQVGGSLAKFPGQFSFLSYQFNKNFPAVISGKVNQLTIKNL